MLDTSEVYVKNLLRAVVDTYKLCFEEMGYDLGETKNLPEYRNYLIDQPLNFNTRSLNDSGYDSNFACGAAGSMEIPPGFYSDTVLYEFISHAEGSVGMQWVTTTKGNEVATGCGIGGWDFPGGVHSPQIAKAIGVTASDFASWVSIDKNSRLSRRAMGGEINEGAAWGWATTPLGSSNPYWQKLIPYYRDAMIWAWHQSIIQNVKEPAERLARMHSINWWGYRNTKLFHGGSGWPHRYEAAKRACAGMPNFA